MQLDEAIICDSNAEKIIEAIEAHLSDGAEAKTDLEKMVFKLFTLDEVVDYALCRNDIVKYIKSTYIV